MAIKYSKSVEYTAYCSLCSYSDTITTIDNEWDWNDTPSKWFQRHGWKNIGGVNFCPKCGRLQIVKNGKEVYYG